MFRFGQWLKSAAGLFAAKAGFGSSMEYLAPPGDDALYFLQSAVLLERFAKKNSVVGACMQQLQRSIIEAPLGVVPAGADPDADVILSGPEYELVNQPNPWMDRNEFLKKLVLALYSTGITYFEKMRPGGGEIGGLFPWPTSWVTPRPNLRGYPAAFDISGQGRRLSIDDIGWAYFPSPDHPFVPLSPLSLASDEILTDKERSEYMFDMLRNSPLPGMIFYHDPEWGPKKRRRAREKVEEAVGGRRRGGILTVPDPTGKGRIDIPTPLRDLDWPGLAGLCETRICAVMGVSPILIHLRSGREAATYANYYEAAQMFYRGTMVALWKMIESALTRAILLDEGNTKLEYRFDLRRVEYLQQTAESGSQAARGAA